MQVGEELIVFMHGLVNSVSNDLSLTQWGVSLGPSCFNLLQRYTQINILSDTNNMLIMYIINLDI